MNRSIRSIRWTAGMCLAALLAFAACLQFEDRYKLEKGRKYTYELGYHVASEPRLDANLEEIRWQLQDEIRPIEAVIHGKLVAHIYELRADKTAAVSLTMEDVDVKFTSGGIPMSVTEFQAALEGSPFYCVLAPDGSISDVELPTLPQNGSSGLLTQAWIGIIQDFFIPLPPGKLTKNRSWEESLDRTTALTEDQGGGEVPMDVEAKFLVAEVEESADHDIAVLTTEASAFTNAAGRDNFGDQQFSMSVEYSGKAWFDRTSGWLTGRESTLTQDIRMHMGQAGYVEGMYQEVTADLQLIVTGELGLKLIH